MTTEELERFEKAAEKVETASKRFAKSVDTLMELPARARSIIDDGKIVARVFDKASQAMMQAAELMRRR